MRSISRIFRRHADKSPTLAQRVSRLFTKHGSLGHAWIPGVGNYQDSAGTIPAGVDGIVGRVDDIYGGIHATQATTGYKPILRRGLVNQLTYSHDLSNAAWTKARLSLSGSVMTATETNGSGFFITRSGISSPGQVVTFAAIMEQGTNQNATINLWDGANGVRCWFNLQNVSVGSQATFGVGVTSTRAEILAIDSTKRLVVFGANIPSGTPQVIVYPCVNSSAGFGCTVGDVGKVIGSSVFRGDVTARQIIDAGGIPLTTTAPASSATGEYWWQFDGVDDFLATGNLNLTSTDKVAVVAGVRKLSDAASGMIAEFSGNASTSNGAFYLYSSPGNLDRYQFSSRGSSSGVVTATGYAAPITNVVSGIGIIGSDVSHIRVGNVQFYNVATDQGAGNFGAYPLYIGRRGGTTLPFNGHIYGLAVVGGMTDLADVTILERWLAIKTGVTL